MLFYDVVSLVCCILSIDCQLDASTGHFIQQVQTSDYPVSIWLFRSHDKKHVFLPQGIHRYSSHVVVVVVVDE